MSMVDLFMYDHHHHLYVMVWYYSLFNKEGLSQIRMALFSSLNFQKHGISLNSDMCPM